MWGAAFYHLLLNEKIWLKVVRQVGNPFLLIDVYFSGRKCVIEDSEVGDSNAFDTKEKKAHINKKSGSQTCCFSFIRPVFMDLHKPSLSRCRFFQNQSSMSDFIEYVCWLSAARFTFFMKKMVLGYLYWKQWFVLFERWVGFIRSVTPFF